MCKQNVAAPPMKCPTDIIFMLDDSASISWSSFPLMKTFVSDFVRRMDIDNGTARVGVVTYSMNVQTVINMNDHSSGADLISAIKSLNSSEGTFTDMATALAYVRTEMLTSAAGDRSNAFNVVVVFTDGWFDDPETQVGIT